MDKLNMYYFLSFADPDTRQSIGVIVMDTPTVDDALREAWRLGINPGGPVAFCKIPVKEVTENNLELNRFYSREEMIAKGYKTSTEVQRLHEN